MKNRLLLFCVWIGFACLGQAKPNVLLILSDDQAWGDYSFLGHEVIETPVLDQLAKDSLTYTRGYVTSPLCRPSLASIFTGKHTPYHGITGNDLKTGGKINGQRSRVNADWAPKHEQLYAGFEKHANLARLLGDAGYLSLQTGKWWEGDPKRHGFTHAMTHGDAKRGARHGDVGLKISREGIAPIQDFLDEAKEKKKPFFIWHAPFLPHTPHNPPKALFEKYRKQVKSENVAKYYAMVEWFDQTCGELFAELEKRGLAKDTIVLYVTDNGWIQKADQHNRYAPRSKQSPYEGGVRTPIMVRWPGRLEPKMDRNTLVSAVDLAPTILKACGVKVPEGMKGIDLRDPEALTKRGCVFGYDGAHDMVSVEDRTGNLEARYVITEKWKLIDHVDGNAELFAILDDPDEKKDVAADNAEVVADLRKKLDGWWKK